MKKVRITVTEGKCNQGFHKVGDSWVVGELTPKGICTSAFNALFPQILTLACGGEFFWEKNARVGYASCPDDTGLTFEIKLEKE
jgi:uncharacterized repeat protein (TIGR04076 family)